jgi:malic enzyme
LAAQVTEAERSSGLLFPSVARLRAVSLDIAAAVVRQAVRDGVADVPDGEIESLVRAAMWEPDYRAYAPL